MQQIPESLKRILKESKELLEEQSEASAHDARELLLEHPDAAEVPLYHLMLARCAKLCGDVESSIRHLEKALELSPDNTTALLVVAEYKLRKQKKEEAKELLRRAKNSPEIQIEQIIKISQLLAQADEIGEAVEFLQDAQASRPNVQLLRKAYATSLKLAGLNESYEKETLLYLETQDLKETVEDRLQLGKYYLSNKEYDKALGVLTPLRSVHDQISKEKSKDLLFINLALCYVKVDNKDRAREMLAMVKRNDTLMSNYVWSELQFAEGDIENAFKSASAVKSMGTMKLKSAEIKSDTLQQAASVSPSSEIERSMIENRLSKIKAIGLDGLEDEMLENDSVSVRSFLDKYEYSIMIGVEG
ncbi:hypothetical protein KBY57_13980 [Cyanobium sp. Aljojuca 7D2]|uniref:tetratricopeptide repeat protein n=1 Tax=Cyanobium sp. Aljojuca 7D2 TaxID=2823698 RepID=UPI0020CCFA0E|nr:hypothetical protein [Cyanobium sp. Aljojuca 7D2]MCP9892150.1 hypothetical protein [Cyanobium sp. Aljojuca 7D2]